MRTHLSVEELLSAARRNIERYTPAQARAAQADGAIIVDVRCRSDRQQEGAVPGAIPLALSVLPWRADPESRTRDDRIANRDARLILMCNDGYSSSLAAGDLFKMGFTDVGDMDGGFHAWAAAGLPLESTD